MASSSKSEVKSSPLLIIGQIIAAHGLTGAVKVRPLTDFPERFQHLQEVYVLSAPEQVAEAKLWRLCSQPHPMKQHQMMLFEGVTDRTIAESLVHAYVAIPRQQAVSLPAETFYLYQLEGLRVVDMHGHEIGVITGIITGAQDLLEVTATDKTHLIPFVKALVPTVDLAQGLVQVDLPDGLLEL